MTPGLVDVRISYAAQRQWKYVEDKTVIKANIDFETGIWLIRKFPINSVSSFRILIRFLKNKYNIKMKNPVAGYISY